MSASTIDDPRPRKSRPAQRRRWSSNSGWLAVRMVTMVCAVYAAAFVTINQIQDSARGAQTNFVVKALRLEEAQTNAAAKKGPAEIQGIENYMVRCVIDQFAHAAHDPYPYLPVPKGCPTSVVIVPK